MSGESESEVADERQAAQATCRRLEVDKRGSRDGKKNGRNPWRSGEAETPKRQVSVGRLATQLSTRDLRKNERTEVKHALKPSPDRQDSDVSDIGSNLCD